MSIIYTGIISLQGCLVCSSKDNRINSIIEIIVSSLDLEIDTRRSFSANDKCFGYSIQVIISNNHAYVTACSPELNHMVSFEYLRDIVKQHGYQDIYTPKGKQDFENYLRRTMETAPSDPIYNPLAPVRKQIEDITDIMNDNIRTAVNRGSSLIEIEDRSNRLLDQSHIFTKTAKALKCAMIRDNLKITAMLILLLLLFMAIIALVIYAAIYY